MYIFQKQKIIHIGCLVEIHIYANIILIPFIAKWFCIVL